MSFARNTRSIFRANRSFLREEVSVGLAGPSINRVLLSGRVGRDPVVKREGGEISEIQFPLVTTETQEGVRTLTWHNVVLRKARSAMDTTSELLAKGRCVTIEGRIQQTKDKGYQVVVYQAPSTVIVTRHVPRAPPADAELGSKPESQSLG